MFAIQQRSIHDQEEVAVISQCILQRIPYRIYSRFKDVPKDSIPVGTVEWCEYFLNKEVTIPDYYPDFLKNQLHRNVWRADKWPLGDKVFIKPSDRHKRFTGFVTSGTYRKKKKGPYWCSDIVKFTNEWRYYVADGKILTGEWYWGDEVNTPNAPKLCINIPNNWCGVIDFGTLDTGELALIEAQPPYACGWYGKDHKLYVDFLIKGWKYLNRS